MLTYNQSLTTAQAFANVGRIEEWIHIYLCSDGHNKAFSDGLKLDKRFFLGPLRMPLNMFKRCCGPEETMKWQVDAVSFDRHVTTLTKAILAHTNLPPLIIQYTSDGFTLTDGNHRWEAYNRLGITEAAVIIWGTGQSDEEAFRKFYNKYL